MGVEVVTMGKMGWYGREPRIEHLIGAPIIKGKRKGETSAGVTTRFVVFLLAQRP